MKKFIVAVLISLPWAASAQHISIIDDERGNKCFAIHAYGLPREVVKTNSEMKASINESGMTKRHMTRKGDDYEIGDDGYDANRKISFAYIIAPHNIDVKGEHTHDDDGNAVGANLTWLEATGWSSEIDKTPPAINDGGTFTGIGPGVGTSIVNPEPTGCAAYKGIDGKDTPGTWRLPTQREALVIFALTDHAIIQNAAAGGMVDVHLVDGDYWTSTEYYEGADYWHTFSVNSVSGIVTHQVRSGAGEAKLLTRCVKDIYYQINE